MIDFYFWRKKIVFSTILSFKPTKWRVRQSRNMSEKIHWRISFLYHREFDALRPQNYAQVQN